MAKIIKKNKVTPQTVLNELDVEKLGEIMKGLVTSLISGQSVESKSILVQLKVPEPIYQIVEEACKATGGDINEVFSTMASNGFTNSLDEILEDGTQLAHSVEMDETEDKPEEHPELQGLDKLAEQMAGLQQFASQLQNISKTMESFTNGIGSGLNVPTKVSKDTK